MPKPPMLHTDAFLPYMRDVSMCEQTLQELNLMWRLIDASARMNCPSEARSILSTLAATRTGFSALERALVATLVEEKVATLQKGMGTKAQYVIDVIVRNLFERTADVGFLATDSELCAFVAGTTCDLEMIRQRLLEYRSKYTVYDDIVLLDPQGQVLARIDPLSNLERCTDSLLATTLASDAYIETCRASELQPHKHRALIYSRRMHHPSNGNVIGVLCLCFDFENEMAGIFQSYRDVGNRSIMLLLDQANRVIASSEPQWIATGTMVPSNREGDKSITLFCGRQYLVQTSCSGGYQGYPGPAGWQGQLMVPIEIAFNGPITDALADLAPHAAAGLLSHAQTFCPALHDITAASNKASDAIQQIVWNGHLLTAGQTDEMQKLRSILDQISETGMRSSILFSQSIQDLFQTVLASSMQEAKFTTNLLVDLLNRNLYERSNDCRWWALTSQLCAALCQTAVNQATLDNAHELLATVNGLYTVYTRIFLYDRSGIILTSTGAANEASIVGSHIGDECLASVLRLAGPQDYHVSPFARSNLYDDRHTDIYHAALRDPANSRVIVGGIGIVFDATPELRNMLDAGLGCRQNMQAFYIDRRGTILSGTDPVRRIGSQLPLDPDLLQLENGNSLSRITSYDGQYAVVACSASSGYREFQISGGHDDGVLAVVFEILGAVVENAETLIPRHVTIDTDSDGSNGIDYATFFCGKNLLAVPATGVQQALPYADMVPATMSSRPERIGLLHLKNGEPGREFIWVFDLAQLLGKVASPPQAHSQVLVVSHGGYTIGLMVDMLHSVTRFSQRQILQMPFASLGASVLITKLIKANQGELLVQLLDLERLFELLLYDDLVEPELCPPPQRSAA
ncbi:MAG: chemotaxis protein CheW [Pseudomonadota bacterium]